MFRLLCLISIKFAYYELYFLRISHSHRLTVSSSLYLYLFSFLAFLACSLRDVCLAIGESRSWEAINESYFISYISINQNCYLKGYSFMSRNTAIYNNCNFLLYFLKCYIDIDLWRCPQCKGLRPR